MPVRLRNQSSLSLITSVWLRGEAAVTLCKKSCCRSSVLSCSAGHYEDNGDDEAVEGESLSEDHHKDQGNQNILLAVRAHTSVANNTDSKTSSKGGKSTAEAGGELLVAESVVIDPLRRVLGNVLIVGDGLHYAHASKSQG